MALSVVALVIALCSLIWNIISTIYTWAIGRPHIKLSLGSSETGPPTVIWVEINVANTGGSPISVQSVSVRWQYNRRSRVGSQIRSAPDEGSGTTGPSLPYTLDAYHAQFWCFDAVRYLGDENRSQP